jgi:hypothetical protein
MFTGPYHNQYNPYSYTPFANRYYNNPYLGSATAAIEEMRMLEGFAIGFDFKGNRLWDYSIPMDELKIPGRDQVSDFVVFDNVPHFIFKVDNELKYVHHQADTSRISDPFSVGIKLKYEVDQAKEREDMEGNVRHWYEDNFYVWGIQSIKQSERKDIDSSRRVFFINKIQVE